MIPTNHNYGIKEINNNYLKIAGSLRHMFHKTKG
jgi:hypothetical protein